MKHKVTFLPMNVTVEVDDADLPYGDHGKPGSILKIKSWVMMLYSKPWPERKSLIFRFE